MPQVVFVTAHDRYATQAFEINALDYLLKPWRWSAPKAVPFEGSLGFEPANHRPAGNHSVASELCEAHAVRSGGKTVFVDVEDVDWIGAAENYVELHASRVSHLPHVTMNTLEKSLDPESFLRIHRSIIVNLVRI
jgi:two-component system LytT family response regulator